MKVLGVSGTPGVGKSSVSRKLSEMLGIPHVDLSKVVVEQGLYVEYDEERQSYVIDEDAVRKYLRRLYETLGPFVLDSHYAEVAPRDILEIVVVLRLDPLKLLDRLIAKNWPIKKIVENVEAELLSVPTINAVEELGEEMVMEIDVTGMSIDDVAREIMESITGEKPRFLGHVIDWLTILPVDKLERLIQFIDVHRS